MTSRGSVIVDVVRADNVAFLKAEVDATAPAAAFPKPVYRDRPVLALIRHPRGGGR